MMNEQLTRLLVINGANLNMLGIREPSIYGAETYAALLDKLARYAECKGIQLDAYQSNHEGALIDRIQQAYFDKVDGIVINPGAYTHTSVALLDALKAVSIPAVEVHISKLDEREAFRQISFVRAACFATVIGEGTDGYLHAIDLLLERLGQSDNSDNRKEDDLCK